MNAQNRWGVTPLMCAVQAPDKGFDVVRALLDHGADVNLNAPLLLAEAAYVPLLLNHGADVNAQNADGETRLIRAAYRLATETARCVLAHGANPHLTTVHGHTARSIATDIRTTSAEQVRSYADAFINVLDAYGARS